MRLDEYLKLMFLLKIDHNFDMNHIENMMIWEKNIQIDILNEYQKEENLKRISRRR